MPTPTNQLPTPHLLALTTQIVAAHVSGNAVAADALPGLIQSVHAALASAGAEQAPEAERRAPAVPIRRSIQREYLVCLEDGAKVKMLKRYLRRFGLTPAEYRERWRLPADYPLVAPAYAEQRSAAAKERGLGRKKAVEPPPSPVETKQRAVARPGKAAPIAAGKRRGAAPTVRAAAGAA